MRWCNGFPLSNLIGLKKNEKQGSYKKEKREQHEKRKRIKNQSLQKLNKGKKE